MFQSIEKPTDVGEQPLGCIQLTAPNKMNDPAAQLRNPDLICGGCGCIEHVQGTIDDKDESSKQLFRSCWLMFYVGLLKDVFIFLSPL